MNAGWKPYFGEVTRNSIGIEYRRRIYSSIMPLFACCSRKIEEVRVLDFRHSGLGAIPSSVFNAERTLESLQLDSNQIKSLPRDLFHCHGLRYLSISDNEITSIPSAISSLTYLEHLDLSKNGILELPDNLKTLKVLQTLNISVNPLGKLPDGFTQLLTITQLCLNDCFLEYLPGNFGRLAKLKILELRENHLKTLPQSVSRLTELERLDIGCNEFTELPDVVGSLSNLLELWCDSNQIATLPKEIGQLKQIMYFDACKNRITQLPDEIAGCISLSDLHLSTNLLKQLPESIGRLSSMTTLKVDDNQLISLPSSIGGLVSLSELDVSANDLEDIPPTIGFLRHLRTLIADENFLSDIPSELGSCSGLTVLSVRSNKLTYLPDEIGRIPRLRVLNLSDNEIKVLPFSLMNLKELQALWLAENQSKALIRLQSAVDPETQRRCLTCYLLPQQRMDPVEQYTEEDNQSFHPSEWEETRKGKQSIKFNEPTQATSSHDTSSSYPKEMRVGNRHVQNEVMRKTNPSEADRELEGQDVVLGSGQSSPCTQTHRLLKLQKEKNAKDRARINRASQEIDPNDVTTALLKIEEPKRHSEKRNHHDKHHHHKHHHHHPDKPDSKPIMNGSLKNLTQASEPPVTIQNGHYNASASRTGERRPSFTSSQAMRNSSGHLNKSETPREQTNGVHRSNSVTQPTKNIQTPVSNPSGSNRSLSGSHNRIPSTTPSQVALNQEDHFGVFTSDADPALYQRRFKYYQRMRKHRNNPEVQSDLGYYGNQYSSSPSKPASDSGSRAYRRPLLHGRDGHDKWERYSQRSMGDGYASDLDGGNKRMQMINNANYRNQRKSNPKLNTSADNRPAIPPPYNAAIANRSDAKLENTPFPAPPPYKPPTRDPGPDGASNDGVPRLSPTQDPASERIVPFQTYETPDQSYAPKSPYLGNRSPYINRSTSQHEPISNKLGPNKPVGEESVMSGQYNVNMRNAVINGETQVYKVSRSKSAYESRRSGTTPDIRPVSSGAPSERPSFYSSAGDVEENSEDREYIAQISKSLGRLGYNKDNDRIANSLPVETVPPPALFSTPKLPTGNNTELYAEVEAAQRVSNEPQRKTNSIYEPINRYQQLNNSTYSHQQSKTPSNNTSTFNNSSNQPPSYNGLLSNHTPGYNSSANHTPAYKYMPPPTRKSPRLPHKQVVPTGIELDDSERTNLVHVTVVKNPGLGFSVAGGIGSPGNPFKPNDDGIFVTKVIAGGAASNILQPGDKIIKMNDDDFTRIEHNQAVTLLKTSPNQVRLTVERLIHTNV